MRFVPGNINFPPVTFDAPKPDESVKLVNVARDRFFHRFELPHIAVRYYLQQMLVLIGEAVQNTVKDTPLVRNFIARIEIGGQRGELYECARNIQFFRLSAGQLITGKESWFFTALPEDIFRFDACLNKPSRRGPPRCKIIFDIDMDHSWRVTPLTAAAIAEARGTTLSNKDNWADPEPSLVSRSAVSSLKTSAL